MRNSIRQTIRTRVLPKRGIRRAHIIGCARSGTTMLHYAMATFQNVSLHQVESDLRYTPSILQSLKLCRHPRGSWLITKREFGWFEPDAVEELISCIVEENIAVILLVRDPRDVLVSRHAGNDDDEFYVNPKRWQKSVAAGDKILHAVQDSVPTLTLRYEDIVLNSDECEARLVQELGFTKNPKLGRLSQLADNMNMTGMQANPWMKRALHSLRNFDQRSVGAWKLDPKKAAYLQSMLNDQPDVRRSMEEFMNKHGYEYDESL